jgi:flotillin
MPIHVSPPLLSSVSGSPGGNTAAAPGPPAFTGLGLEIPLLTAAGLGLLLAGVRWIAPNCRPDQVLVIAGRRGLRRGQSVGYRVVHGGRTVVLPLLERGRWLDVRNQLVQVEVQQAFAHGGTPLDVKAIAIVKISTDADVVGNAVERFLQMDPEEVNQVAARTLEGHLRAMVASLTPEQVNQDRLRFAAQVLEVTRPDMDKLGLQVDIFKILQVVDRVDYLDSLGRARLAEVLRDAAIAEAEAFSEADQVEAQAEERSEVAASRARTLVEESSNGLRRVCAELDGLVRSAEERVEAVAAEARARAEQKLQHCRVKLERQRLEADVVLPARARQEAEDWLSRGAAAATAENARASASVNDQLAELWRHAGDQAAAIFLLQQIEMVLEEAVAMAGQLRLGPIAVLETGDPAAIARLAALHPTVLRTFLEQVRDTLGIDVLGALQSHSPTRS